MGRENLSTAENLFDFFHEQVDTVVANRQVPVGRESVYYITNLLVERSRSQPEPKKLVDLHLEAREADQAGAVRAYRQLGDEALYVSGFFRESVERGIVSVSYYQDMGAAAYDTLARLMAMPAMVSGDLGHVFSELSKAFTACSEALCRVREQLRGDSDGNILALYRRWLIAGDQRAAQRLRELGFDPENMTLLAGSSDEGAAC